MAWEFGSKYRVKVVPAQYVIKTLPTNRTKMVEVMLEVTDGPMKGQRVPYSGYLNSLENAARTRADLVVMGWQGVKWGDWKGLGTGREFQITLLSDDGRNGERYPRAAFPSPIRKIDLTHVASDSELDELNAALGDLEQLDNIAGAQEHDRKNPVRGGYSSIAEEVPFD